MTGSLYSALQSRRIELGPFDEVSGAKGHWKHWRLVRDSHNVAWLLMDKQDSSVNVLSQALLSELDEILGTFQQDVPQALVIRSAKPNGFCAGADIKEFRHLESEDEVASKLSAAHEVAQKLIDVPCPTIAVVHGQTLGGGLELALCCDYRIAIRGVTMGTPEILLGLHPGLGGTVRLCQLIDPVAAMTMMLTGKNTRDRKAKSLGLVDDIVEERHLANAIAAAVEGRLKPHKQKWRSKLFALGPVRRYVAKKMRAQAGRKAPPEHYPAPEALIGLWESYGGNARVMLEEEVNSFARLLVSPASRNLVRVFFLREKMKKLASDADDGAEPLKHLHVIGAGAMGGDIANWCALQGLRVTLFDMQKDVVAQAVGKLEALCRKRHLSSAQTRDVLDRLIPDFQNQGVAHADMVLEAVPEDIQIKHRVFADVEPRMKPGAVLATNTSSIALEDLSTGLKNPGRLVGVHFFNPVAMMQLVEIVEQEAAEAEVLARARQFVGQIGRLPTPVSSAPGFLVNRALTPYLVEALLMLDEGVPAEAIDQVALDFGMPMGPAELADQVGLDIGMGVAKMLTERLDSRLPPLPDWFQRKVEAGDLGRKTGQGLYTWKDGQPQKKQDMGRAPDDTLDRLILPMLNACMACLREGVVQDADLLDGAMIFGTGFAPFRGGPMHYAKTRGYADIQQTLQSLAHLHGDRFLPDEGWASSTADTA